MEWNYENKKDEQLTGARLRRRKSGQKSPKFLPRFQECLRFKTKGPSLIVTLCVNVKTITQTRQSSTARYVCERVIGRACVPCKTTRPRSLYTMLAQTRRRVWRSSLSILLGLGLLSSSADASGTWTQMGSPITGTTAQAQLGFYVALRIMVPAWLLGCLMLARECARV